MSLFWVILFFSLITSASFSVWKMEQAVQKHELKCFQELTHALSELLHRDSEPEGEQVVRGKKLCEEFFLRQPYVQARERCLSLSLLELRDLPPLSTASQITGEIFKRLSNSPELRTGDNHQAS